MFNISSFLKKFSNNIENVELQKAVVVEIFKKILNIDLTLGDLEIKNNILYVKGSPALKNIIFLNKTKILNDIKLNNVNISDIK